jgi:hypothetical protein
MKLTEPLLLEIENRKLHPGARLVMFSARRNEVCLFSAIFVQSQVSHFPLFALVLAPVPETPGTPFSHCEILMYRHHYLHPEHLFLLVYLTLTSDICRLAFRAFILSR